ncbi:MAG: flagellar hook-basal body complex protein [Planctomycetes bacterium]|nr:flagellar hook-basal body complex protein [Planctomycetota bacterium]
MGLSQSLYSGISGLKTHQTAMDNVGNNLANVNTVAFKKGVFQFRTLLEQTLRGGSASDGTTGRGAVNPLQVGLGTSIGSIRKDFTTGSVETTGNQKDMMIDGNGFFVLRNGNSNVYTRDGAFYLGSDGTLLYGDGLQVQGIQADASGKISPTGSYTDITIPIGQTGAAIETTKASFTGNLNSNVETANGLKLAANPNAINLNDALSAYLGEVKNATHGTGTDDSTWNALTGDAYINGGTVWTSSSFGVKNPETGAMEPAVLTGDNATRLEDLWYLSGSTWVQPFKNIDNPPTFTVNGASQNYLTGWKFNSTGFRMLEDFSYQLTANPDNVNHPGEFILEIYDTPYDGLVDAIMAAATQADVLTAYNECYSHLLTTTGSTTSPAHNTLADVARARYLAIGGGPVPDEIENSRTTNADFTPQGSDLVTFTTTNAGIAFAQQHDSSITAAQARSAFDGSVKFGNTLAAGAGTLHGYTATNIDQDITVSYSKGGRSYTATFTYSDKNGAQSYTIEHLMKFLCGNVDSTASTASAQSIQNSLSGVGGVMGTIQVGGKISSSIDGGEYGYNVPVETAGAFTRSGIANNVAYAGQFKASGTDSSQLTNLDLDASGYALKNKWYYGISAYDDGNGGLQYAVTTYSDSARTNAVATSEKMLGSGSQEMRRSINITDTATLGDATYSYTTTFNENTNEYSLNIIDEAGTVVARATGVVGANCNILATDGGDNVGTVTFGLTDMTAGDTGTIYMANMQDGLAESGSNISLVTTISGDTYAQNNGIGVYSAKTAFDSSLHLGDYPTTSTTSPSYGTFDTSGSSVNYSIVSNLGMDNAVTDIIFSYNNVTYSDVWVQDTQYSAEQGGSSTTNIVVYDSLGNPKEITITLSLVDRDSDFSTYRWIAESMDDTDANWQIDPTSKEITTNSNVGTGTIRFDANGQFVKGVEYSETAGIELTLKNQGVSDILRIALTEGLSKNYNQDLDFSYLTQVATSSDFNLKEQDGSAPGTLESCTTSLDGIIQGVYSNGVVRNIARLALSLVPNENGLMSAGGNLFTTSPASGDAQIAFASVGGRGDIRAAAIETSNVDLSEEFTELITVQRGFQANSRIISTSDEMLEELVNLVR